MNRESFPETLRQMEKLPQNGENARYKQFFYFATMFHFFKDIFINNVFLVNRDVATGHSDISGVVSCV